MTRASCCIVGIAIAFNAAGLEQRASPGSQLKTSPGPSRGPLSSAAPLSPPAPPAIATPVIRLVGPQTGKQGTPALPDLVTTSALQLWGAGTAGLPIQTASLVLLGPTKEAISTIETAPIRLWGLP